MHIVDIIANQGRNGDNTVGHLTDGEIVVPKSAIDDDLLDILGKKIDVKRYTVGNKKNSVNPDTGMFEFFDAGESTASDADANDDGSTSAGEAAAAGSDSSSNGGGDFGTGSAYGGFDSLEDALGFAGLDDSYGENSPYGFGFNPSEKAAFESQIANQNSFVNTLVSILTPLEFELNPIEPELGRQVNLDALSVVGAITGIPGLGLAGKALGFSPDISLGYTQGTNGQGFGSTASNEGITADAFGDAGSDSREEDKLAEQIIKAEKAIQPKADDTPIYDFLKERLQGFLLKEGEFFADMPQFQLLNNEFGTDILNDIDFDSIFKKATNEQGNNP